MSDMYFKNLPDTTTPITDVNLNKLNDVKVSTTEPITGEKIWIKKGKNLLNKDTIFRGYIETSSQKIVVAQDEFYSCYARVTPNTTYTISKQAGKSFRIATTNIVPTDGVTYNSTTANHTGTSITITTGANDNYICIFFYATSNGDTGGYENMANTIQVEQNPSATTYESYVGEKILVKNDNGVYEEFINISDVVSKSGDVMIAPLRFENTDNYNAIRKSRIISGQEYELTLGIGGNKSARIELVNAGTVVGAIEVRDDGTIYNSKTNKKLAEESIQEGTLVDTSNYFSSIDVHRVIKQGKVAQIAFRGLLSRNISPSDKILKSSYTPFYGSNGAGVVYLGGRYTTDNLAWFYMDGSGYIQGITATSGKYIHINYTYIMS